MRMVRRDALRLLGVGVGAGVGGAVLPTGFSAALAAPPTNYIDHYCNCSDILVAVEPAAALNVIATGENHSLWASSIKREISPGLWVGTSVFTNRESIHLRFKVDPQRYLVDYMVGEAQDSIDAMRIANWARVVPGELLGYPRGTSLVALYQPRRAGADLDAFLRGRNSHNAEMFRIKAVAERGAVAQKDALLPGEYLASYSEQVPVSDEILFDFISSGTTYGKYTWGRSPRSMVGANTFLCKSDFGEPDILVRLEVDRARKTVDYYVGQSPDAMLLYQSARVFPGPAFGYDANISLVTFTRWRAAGQSNYDWDRAMSNQVEETRMTKSQLESGTRG